MPWRPFVAILPGMSKSRLEAFSDGVFAIAITLLVLDVKLPPVADAALGHAMVALLPRVGVYVITFAIVGVYWVAHHSFLGYFERVDRTALWLNNLVLLLVAFLPFPTSVLGAHPGAPAAVLLYASALAGVNVAGTALWAYGAAGGRLVSSRMSPRFARRVVALHGTPAAVYLLGGMLGHLAPAASIVVFVAVPTFFIVPNPLIAQVTGAPWRDGSPQG